jgi:hypothetical protein
MSESQYWLSEEVQRLGGVCRAGEFWSIMFSQASAPLLLHLVRKHYIKDLAEGDAAACVVTCKTL